MQIDLFHDTACPWCRIGKRPLQLAQQAGISGVPFFIVNDGYAWSGAQPPEAVLQMLRSCLKDAAPPEPEVETIWLKVRSGPSAALTQSRRRLRPGRAGSQPLVSRPCGAFVLSAGGFPTTVPGLFKQLSRQIYGRRS